MVSPCGKPFRFVSLMRACLRADWLSSGIRSPKWPSLFFLFRLGSPSFPSPPQPQNFLSNFSWVYRSVYIYIYVYIGGWEVSPSGNSFRFVSFVRPCARSGCLVELENKSGAHCFPFSRLAWRTFPFSFPPLPKPPIQLSVGLSAYVDIYIYIYICIVY